MTVAGGSIDVECTKAYGELSIDGETCHRKAFCALDVTSLRSGPIQRGSDILIPTLSGTLAMPRRPTTTAFSVPILIDGYWTVAGVATTNPMQGLWDTVLWIRENMSDPTESGDGTREVVLTDPNDESTTYEADAHINMLLGAITAGRYQRASLEISVPAGSLSAS